MAALAKPAANPAANPAPPQTTGAIPPVSMLSPAQSQSGLRVQERRVSRAPAATRRTKA